MKNIVLVLLVAVSIVTVAGCKSQHKVEMAPVEIKPIHITIDVNVRVDRALDNFFEDIDTVDPQPSQTDKTVKE